MRIKYLYPVGLFFFIIFVSCENGGSYPKVEETLLIRNNTDTLLIVEYRFQYDTASYYGQHNRDTVFSKYQTRRPLPDYQGKLWMGVAEFEHFVSRLTIYRVEGKDTFFVNPRFFSYRNQWTNHLSRYYGGDIFHEYTTPGSMQNENFLTISSNMFTK